MLRIEQFKELKVGDMFESGTMLAGLGSEKIVFVVESTERDPMNGNRLETAYLSMTYEGVRIGGMKIEYKGALLDWTEIQNDS